jgi:Cys-rich protein (TIGR01571 family)
VYVECASLSIRSCKFDTVENSWIAIAVCCSACFPCIAFACIADIVDQGSECQCLYCACYLLTANLGLWRAYAGWYRRKLRQQYGLVESPMPDNLTHLLCHWCALAQEYRELAKRGFDVDQGKHTFHHAIAKMYIWR